MTVFGDARNARAHPGLWARGQRLAAERERATIRRTHAEQQLGQRLLPVAGDPGDRDDLAGAQVEVDAAQPRAAPGPRDRDATQRADQVAWGFVTSARRALRGRDRAPDHQRRERRLARVLRADGRDQLAAAQHRHAVRDAQHFVELVADEDHAEALRDELLQRAEQADDFGWREHRGRLVEDQHLRALSGAERHQSLKNLDPLTLADREARDTRIRVDLQPEAPRGIDQLRARRSTPRERLPQRLGAEHHVVKHAEVVGEREMLMHHADAGGKGGARVAGRQHLTESLDAAFVGDIVAEQDRHQRALAGAVLAEQREHLSARQRQRDGVVRDQTAEALGNAFEAKDDFGRRRRDHAPILRDALRARRAVTAIASAPSAAPAGTSSTGCRQVVNTETAARVAA